MTDKPPERFKIIDGGKLNERPSVELTNICTGQTHKFEAHQCQRCTEDLGFPFDRLVVMRVGGIVNSRGMLEGGHDYWCCCRCFQAYYDAE
jgi:hypothetical protein